MRYIVLILLVLAVGCAQLLRAQDKGAEEIARAINKYCSSTDEDFRANLREAINEKAAPNSIEVTCGE